MTGIKFDELVHAGIGKAVKTAVVSILGQNMIKIEPRNEKTCVMPMQTTKAQISLRIRTV